MLVFRILVLIIFIFGLKWVVLVNYDPDIFRTTPEMIESRGFITETYQVTTPDGYILTLFRIKNPFNLGQPKPVLVLHGTFETSDVWLMLRPGHINQRGIYTEDKGTVINNCGSNLTGTLGFTLSSCGYDVWLLNTRGNQYSDQNVKLNFHDPRFWSFTITEQALYDIPTVVSFVLNKTKRSSVAFIGYSEGSAQMWALLSLRPEFEKYIKPFISLGTTTSLKHINSQFLRILAAIFEPILRPLKGPIGFTNESAQSVSILLTKYKTLNYLSARIFQSSINEDMEQLDLERFPMYVGKIFAQTPLRANLAHIFTQTIHGFREFDYGLLENLLIYNRPEPLEYPIERIRSKNIAIIYGLNDITSLQDFEILKKRLRVPLLAFVRIDWTKWNHFDNVLAKDSNIYLIPHVISILKEMQ